MSPLQQSHNSVSAQSAGQSETFSSVKTKLELIESRIIKFAFNATGTNKDWDFKKLAANFQDVEGTLADVQQHIKAGHAICAGLLGGKWRSKANVIGSQWLLLDIDNSNIARDAYDKPIKDENGIVLSVILSVKVSGNGKAKVLNPAELSRLMIELQKSPRNACLYAICFYTACRISEALHLRTTDISEDYITFRKATTKGRLKTRTIPVNDNLQRFLIAYQPRKAGPMFPGQTGVALTEYLSRSSADRILKQAARRARVAGVSTHSFRRTSLTYMYRAGIPLRTILEISGHNDLATLQLYLEVLPEDVISAINVLSF